MGLAAQLQVAVPPPGMVGRMIGRFGSTRTGAAFFARTLHHADRAVLTISGQRTSLTDLLAAIPTVWLTTTGARTGVRRTVPLVAVPVGDDLAVIGSNFGRSQHPGWVHNLSADPRATLMRHGRVIPVRAREATSAEAERVWARACEMYPGYITYPKYTGGRDIRVYVLRPDLTPA